MGEVRAFRSPGHLRASARNGSRRYARYVFASRIWNFARASFDEFRPLSYHFPTICSYHFPIIFLPFSWHFPTNFLLFSNIFVPFCALRFCVRNLKIRANLDHRFCVQNSEFRANFEHHFLTVFLPFALAIFLPVSYCFPIFLRDLRKLRA